MYHVHLSISRRALTFALAVVLVVSWVYSGWLDQFWSPTVRSVYEARANTTPYVGFFSPSATATAAGNANLALRQPDPRTGDLMVAAIAIRPAASTVNTPTGWTALGSWTGSDGGAEGADTGSVGYYWFYKVADGSEGTANVTFTENGTTSVWNGTIMQFRSSTGTYDLNSGGYSINADATNWNGTPDGNVGLTAGDVVLIAAATNGNPSAHSAQNITATGISAKGTVREHAEYSSTTGNDIEFAISDVHIWTGTSTADPTVTYTQSVAASGVVSILRVRQGSGTNRSDTWVRAAGAQVAGSTSVALPYPAHDVGDLLIMFIGNKHTAATPTTPSGWTLIANSYTGSAGTDGIDTGSTRVSAYYRQVTSQLTGTQSVTITSGNVTVGQIISVHKDDVATWVTDVDGGGDSTAGTSWSVTGSGLDLSGAFGGDIVLVGSSINTDAYTYSAHALSATGITFGDVTQTAEFRTATGNDMTLEVATGRVSAGSGSNAPTHTKTASGSTASAPAGAGIFIKVIGLVPSFDQSSYRFFTNANSTDVGSALAAQNTAATLSVAGDAFRLRQLIHVGTTTLTTSGQQFKLQYAVKSGTCDVGFSGETYADVTSGTAIAFNNNATPADGDNLTANANDPTHGGDTIVNQDYEEVNDFTNSVAAITEAQDGKWDFALYDNGAPSGTSYCFRIVKSDNTVLDSYEFIPEVSTASSASLTFVISHDNFPNLSPGTPVFATTTLSVNYSGGTGWNVTLSGDDQSPSNTVMDLSTDSAVGITDQLEWIPGSATTSPGNAVRISSLDSAGDVLAFRVMTASGSVAFRAATWWGSADSYSDNANTLWAGIASSTVARRIGNSSVSSGGGPALSTVLYYLDVPATQQTGTYTGGVTYTATANP